MDGTAVPAYVRDKSVSPMPTHSSDTIPATMPLGVTCPFCGLLCDDLAVGMQDGLARVEAGVCARAAALFPVPARQEALVEGRAVPWVEAAKAAARLLAGTRRPLIGGLGCDIAGQRAAVALAERVDGALDHMHGRAQLRNQLPFQDGGWMATTLSELRNRADVVVLAGTLASGQPRFFERCLAPSPLQSQFGDLHRRILLVGSPPHLLKPAAWPAGADIAIDCPNTRLAEVFGLLRARLSERRLDAETLYGIAMQQFDGMLDTMRSARYGVLVWDASELDFPHADLAVRAMIDLVRDLNRKTRWSVLPLGGADGGTSATQVGTWLTGYPLRMRFEAGAARDDPQQRTAEELLEQGAVDGLVWISAFDPARKPPLTRLPTIVLGRADMAPAPSTAVFIPVAVPGVQRAGLLSRMDQIVTLPLSAPAASALPSAAEVLARIMEELHDAASA